MLTLFKCSFLHLDSYLGITQIRLFFVYISLWIWCIEAPKYFSEKTSRGPLCRGRELLHILTPFLTLISTFKGHFLGIMQIQLFSYGLAHESSASKQRKIFYKNISQGLLILSCGTTTYTHIIF